MTGVFDDPEPEPELAPARVERVPELTLGTATLFGLFFGLVVVCAACFALGYEVGRRGSAVPAQQSGIPKAAQPQSAQAKPSASAAANAWLRSPAAGSQPSPAPDANSPAIAQGSPAVSGPPSTSAQAQTSSGPSAAATSQAANLTMVQIAAIAHQEDADVLMDALRKHDYPVTAERGIADNLIHVRIGPFANRNDAVLMRDKLLNDGYNAVLQP